MRTLDTRANRIQTGLQRVYAAIDKLPDHYRLNPAAFRLGQGLLRLFLYKGAVPQRLSIAEIDRAENDLRNFERTVDAVPQLQKYRKSLVERIGRRSRVS